MKDLKLQDFIIIDTPFEYGLFKIETTEQLEQATSDNNITKFSGTADQADEIIELQNMLYRLLRTNEENLQRCNQLKYNIKMMINKHLCKGL